MTKRIDLIGRRFGKLTVTSYVGYDKSQKNSIMMKPYKELDLEQGSIPWLQARKEHITATDTSKINGKNPWSSPIDCYNEKINGKTTPLNSAMQRGHELEIKARKFLEMRDGIQLKPRCFESTIYPYIMASLDAVSSDYARGYEIKCPQEKAMAKALSGTYDEYYIWQLQTQMLVMGWKSITLFYYHSDYINISFEIKRDEKLIKSLIKTNTSFWNKHILEQVPPAKYGDEFERIDDERANELAKRWDELNDREKDAKFEKDKVAKQLEKYTKNKNCIFPSAGIKHQVIERKGTVDWKIVQQSWKISEEDVNKHRKQSSLYSKFSDM